MEAKRGGQSDSIYLQIWKIRLLPPTRQEGDGVFFLPRPLLARVSDGAARPECKFRPQLRVCRDVTWRGRRRGNSWSVGFHFAFSTMGSRRPPFAYAVRHHHSARQTASKMARIRCQSRCRSRWKNVCASPLKTG